MAPRRLTSNVSLNLSVGEEEEVTMTPALLTRVSIRPNWDFTWVAAVEMEIEEVTSSSRGEIVPLVEGRARRVVIAAVAAGRDREERMTWYEAECRRRFLAIS